MNVPTFNTSSTIQKKIMILVCFVLFCLCVFKTINVAIFGDEAHSYFTYMLNWNFLQNIKPSSANNHLLNSFLGWLNLSILGDFLKLRILYNVFVIRLHILFFYMIFLIYSIKITRFFKFHFLPFSLLLSCYYVHNYFSLARGYAIAISLVLTGSYYYLKWMHNCIDDKSLTLAYCLYIAACYGNTIALLSFAPLLIDSFYRLLKKKLLLNYIRHNYIFLPVFIFLTCYAVYYHFSIVKLDIPLNVLFENYESSTTIPFFSEYAKMYFSHQKPLQFILTFLLLTVMCISFIKHFRKLKTMPFFCMFLYFVGICVFSKILFHAYLPTRRALIPSVPLLILAISELLDKCPPPPRRRAASSRALKSSTRINTHICIFQDVVLVMLWFSFLINYSGYKDVEWSNSSQMRDKIYQAFNEGRKIDYIEYTGDNPPYTFYTGKILYEHNVGVMLDTTFPTNTGEELKIAGNNKYLYSWAAARNEEGYLQKDISDGPLVFSKQYIVNPGKYKICVALDFPNQYETNSGYVRIGLDSNYGRAYHGEISVTSNPSKICLDNILFHEHTVNVRLFIITNIPNLVFKDCTIIRIN